jgi:DNA polymerase-1
VRQAHGEQDKTKGTRTGRLSGSKPNFQNVANEYTVVIPKGYPVMPLMRSYLLPDKGMVWLKRDYSQQELRILAHFSEGRLYERYKANPKIDAHEETSALITEHTGLSLPRKLVKITGFSVIYGSGLGSLAEQMGVPYSEAQQVRNAYFTALPEVPKLMRLCSERGRHGQTITTWGGREYPVEPPKLIGGRHVDFSYKLLNYLIQGSAGDCTKESIIRWNEDKGNGEFLATVHDENDIQAPRDTWLRDMAKLRKAMEGIEFDVKMLSDGFKGPNWAQLEACK